MEFVIYFSKLERCEVIIKARPTRVIRYLAIVALCLLLGFMLGRKSKYEKRDYLKQFKIGKATYSESLIYEAYGGLQNDGIMLAVYYDVDAAKIIHQLDSWEKINDSPTISSILKNVSSYFGLDFVIPEIASGNFFLYDNSQHKELRSEAEMNTLLLHGETTAGYFPNGKISDIDLSDLYAIIGSNDITVVDNPTATPYCSTVCLQITTNNGGTNYGSGFMIGPNALATAAHNLYSIKEKAYVKSVNVAPARSDNSKPFGSENVSASSMIVSDSYLAGTSSEDWAIITLKNNLGTKTGWLGLHWQSSNYSSSQLVYAYGYPSQINGADARYRMCKSSGYIRSQTSKYLKGDWDLTGGFSGGPLVEYISGAGYVAIGIHKDGSTIDGSSYPTSYTGALRITQSLYTLFLSYRG